MYLIKDEVKCFVKGVGESVFMSFGEMVVLVYFDCIGLYCKGDVLCFVFFGGKGVVMVDDDFLVV